MFNIDRLKRDLPFCTKIDILKTDNQAVVECVFINTMKSRVEVTRTPSTDQELIDVVVASAAQSLSVIGTKGVFWLDGRDFTILRADARGSSAAFIGSPHKDRLIVGARTAAS